MKRSLSDLEEVDAGGDGDGQDRTQKRSVVSQFVLVPTATPPVCFSLDHDMRVLELTSLVQKAGKRSVEAPNIFVCSPQKRDKAFACLLRSARLGLTDDLLLPPLLTPAWTSFAAALVSFGLLKVMPQMLFPFVKDFMLCWREETHHLFSASVRERVVTALMCLHRMAPLPSELRCIILRKAFRMSDEWCDNVEHAPVPLRDDNAHEELRHRMLRRLFCAFVQALQEDENELVRLFELVRLIMSDDEHANYDDCVRLMNQMIDSVTNRSPDAPAFNPVEMVGVLQQILQYFGEFCDMREIVHLLQHQVGHVVNIHAEVRPGQNFMAQIPEAQRAAFEDLRHVGGVGVQIRVFVNGVPPGGDAPPPEMEEMIRQIREQMQDQMQEHFRMHMMHHHHDDDEDDSDMEMEDDDDDDEEGQGQGNSSSE